MDKVLPSEILIQIFLSLPVNAVQAASDTCVYWRNIIENFNLWKNHWFKLLDKADKCLKEETCKLLKQQDINDLNLKYSCFRLNNIIFNDENELQSCLLEDNTRKYDYAILKTHHSHVTMTMFKNMTITQRSNPFYYVKMSNESCPTSPEFILFRTPPKIIENIDKLFDNQKQNLDHIHVKRLYYFYPMSISKYMEQDLLKQFFETCHVEEVILIPRVLMLCENLDLTDAVVVYSSSRSTEVAIVVNGCVLEDRWCELPVGGWKVAENLYSTFSWLHPNTATEVERFDDPNIKSLCWVKMSPTCDDKREVVTNLKAKLGFRGNEQMFILKNEQYLAAEVMYAELELYSVIKNLLEGLSDEVISNCLSHVLLTGGNCKLKHMHIRVKLDLMKVMPQYANIITTSVHSGRMLAYSPNAEAFETKVTEKFEPGRRSRLKREHYIIGTDL